MIEKTLKKLKEAEKFAQIKIKVADQLNSEKIKKIQSFCDNDWDALQKKLINTEREIIEKYKLTAEEECNKIKKEEDEKIAAIKNLFLKKKEIIKKVVKDLATPLVKWQLKKH